MSCGFMAMDALRHLSVQQQFVQAFNEPFVRTTYFEQRNRWNKATEEQRQVAIKAGRTEAGSWKTFQRLVRIR